MDKEYSISIDGEPITFEFKDSLIHSEGELAGQIDAIITTKPPLPQNLLLDELHIKVPGTNEYLYIYGYGVVENSLKATFNSSDIVDTQKLPDMVEVYWGANGEQFIGEMCCQRYTKIIESEISEKIEDINESEDSNKNQEVDSSVNKIDEKPDSVNISKSNNIFLYIAVLSVLIFVVFLMI